MIIGIMGAMPEEVSAISELLNEKRETTVRKRAFIQGNFGSHEVVIVYSRVGKVSSASTATTLINDFKVDNIIFFGIAGGVTDDLNIGDIVIADQCIQHDMDASPLFPKYEIPLTQQSYFGSDPELVQISQVAVERFLKDDFQQSITDTLRKQFQLYHPKVEIGTIATGDQFIKDPMKITEFKTELNHVLAVDMESGAVAQICDEYEIPYVSIRVLSDKANTKAPEDFHLFLTEITTHYAKGIIKHLLLQISN